MDTERALHVSVARGSGEDGNGRRIACTGDVEASVFTEVNVRKPD
jgi:hypothetical protein